MPLAAWKNKFSKNSTKQKERSLEENRCVELLYHGDEGRFGTLYPAEIVFPDEACENSISERFKEIRCTNVKEIRFRKHEIEENIIGCLKFPNYFGRFSSVAKVVLVNHKLLIDDQGCALFTLKSLEILRLVKCNLKSIPDEICKLENLKELNIGVNLIKELPEGLFNLKLLTELRINNNDLTNISEKINQLVNLRILWLSENKLTSFPEISTEMNLEILDLSSNKIKMLPNSISRLKSLTELYINNNQLSSLPDDIGELKHLKLFNFINNMITCLPESSLRLMSCGYFFFGNNPLQRPPPEILSKGVEGVKGYFNALKKFSGYHADRCKIILIGETMAGKTSLCQALVECKAGKMNDACRTEGIDLYKWKVRPELDDLEALVVDCAGQRKYMITHSFFISQGCLFLLVLDLYNYQPNVDCYRKNVGNWINVILAYSPDATILIVPTHLDLFKQDENDIIHKRCEHVLENVRKDDEKRGKDLITSRLDDCETDIQNTSQSSSFAGRKSHISTFFQLGDQLVLPSNLSEINSIKMIPISSCGKLAGVQDLRQEIIKVLTNPDIMPLVGREIPSIYPKLEEYCVNQRSITPVMKLNKFVATVGGKLDMNKEMMISALHYFDTIGSVLYFSYGEKLNQFVFLDPKWFINVLKKLFNHNTEGNLIFKDKYIDMYHLSFDEFEQLKEELLESGRLAVQLLRCIWSDIEYISTSDDIFYFLIDIMCHFNLIIKIENQNDLTGNSSMVLLVPWYFKPATEDVLCNHWPKQKDDQTIEITSQFTSIVSPLPIGSFERFVASVYHQFCHSVAWQDTLLGIEKNCRICCTIHNSIYGGRLTLKGRCRKDNIDDLWMSLLPIFKTAEDFFKQLPGLGCIKRQSLCPSCCDKSIKNPYMFNIPCWFLSGAESDDVACRKEHKLIPSHLILPPKDVIHRFQIENGNETMAPKSIPNDKVDLIFLDEVSQIIGPVPRALGRCLGLAHHTIENICYNNRFENVTEQNMAIFTAWIEQIGENATLLELYRCLTFMNPKPIDALDFIRNYQQR